MDSKKEQHAIQVQPETAGTIAIAGPSNVGIALQAQGVTINSGDFVQAGRDAIVTHHHHHHHHPPAPKVDIAFLLRLVRNLRQIQQDNFSKATYGTGVWILITNEFILWLDPNGNLKILWGTGIPGAGKTVLASIVINDLEARAAASGGRICVAYIYFRYTDGADVSVRDVLEVLVKQTIERHGDCKAIAEEAYTRHVQEDTQPTETELLQLLRRFTEAKSITFYILDALDEAPVRLQVDVVKKLVSLNVRLFITSRPLKTVEARYPDAHGFQIIAREDDLDLHISQEISRSRDLQDLLDRADPSMRSEIVSHIKENCGGMFLHASLQLNELSDCASPYEVMEVLKSFPAEIEDVYVRTWDRILTQRASHVSTAKSILLWVLYATEPLTIDILERAVATCPSSFKFEAGRMMSKETLMTTCCGLVTIEDRTRLVRLVHYTAKEPLQKLLRKSPPHAHALLAAVCVAHLAQCEFQSAPFHSRSRLDDALEQDPLLAYAHAAWASHARNSLEIAESRLRTTSFVSQCKAFPYRCGEHKADVLCPLHMLALYNLPLDILPLDEVGDPNLATGTQKATPLQLASSCGNEDMVRHLLHLEDIQVNLRDEDGWSALMHAALEGHEGVARLLLAHPEIQVNLVDGSGGSALICAATRGHGGVVKLLLGHPAIQVNSISRTFGSPLAAAASYGREEVVRLLLGHPNIQVNCTNNRRRSALMQAVDSDHGGVVKLLLEHPDIQVNFVDYGGQSILMHAAYAGREEIVELLLGHPDIQVNLTDNSGESALARAYRRGHASVVSALLAHPGTQDDRELAESWLEEWESDDDASPSLSGSSSSGGSDV